MEIRVGTSGYSFEDWRGNFYPGQIEKGKMLDYYQNYFNTVEINSTYYRIPHPAVLVNMARKTKPDFEFVVKANENLTHTRKEIKAPARQFLEAVKPLAEKGQLKGILAQFPWSFQFSPVNLTYITTCAELMAPHRLFVEFRHDSWLRDETFRLLKTGGMNIVSVDGPKLPGLLPSELMVTGDIGYIRLHGRNAAKWWDGGPLRYDYLYNDRELREWKEKLDKISGEVTKAYIFFNNCHLGQAVKNARDLMRILDL